MIYQEKLPTDIHVNYREELPRKFYVMNHKHPSRYYSRANYYWYFLSNIQVKYEEKFSTDIHVNHREEIPRNF